MIRWDGYTGAFYLFADDIQERTAWEQLGAAEVSQLTRACTAQWSGSPAVWALGDTLECLRGCQECVRRVLECY